MPKARGDGLLKPLNPDPNSCWMLFLHSQDNEHSQRGIKLEDGGESTNCWTSFFSSPFVVNLCWRPRSGRHINARHSIRSCVAYGMSSCRTPHPRNPKYTANNPSPSSYDPPVTLFEDRKFKRHLQSRCGRQVVFDHDHCCLSCDLQAFWAILWFNSYQMDCV